ncbi:MAG: amidohydrolase family protein [Gammaproteobacteria bacterium]|nr:amidohydrolase family protein [Gammaproteobacteria bacterium]
MSTYDILIKNGTVVDGTGAPARHGDVAISDGHIVEVGQVSGSAARVIDAAGRLVTPGFVDIHSHLDAQFAWDPIGSSSCWHGVTSVVVGNCGVTFAPVRPDDHAKLAKLMESVEDIPAKAIMSGLKWNWQTYGEYYDALDASPKGINVGGMVGHCALRYYAMGDRCLDSKNHPTDDELALMVAAVDEALAAGALGVSSSRILGHRTPEGQPVPGTFAEKRELFALAYPLGVRGRGLFELVPRFETDDPANWAKSQREIDWMAEMSRVTGRPVTYSFFQFPHLPTQYRAVLEMTRRCNAAGANVRPQTTARGIGVLFGPQLRSPFDRNPAWRAMRKLTVAEKLAVYADPVRRAELVREANENGPFADELERLYVLEGPDPDYTPDRARSLPALAAARGVSLADVYIDVMLASEGTAFINHPHLNPTFEAVEEMLSDPMVVLGLADSGAHVGQIMDASQPTWLMSYWVRKRGLFGIEEAIRRLTSDTASLFGISDRGRLAPGARADVNIIDFDRLRLHMPDFIHDFPAGAGRLIQKADGYDYTLVNGQVFMEGGEHTGALVGELLRSGVDLRARA